MTTELIVTNVCILIGSPGRSPRSGGLLKQKSNPIMLVGQGVKAGINTLHEAPQQAMGHIMGGAGGGHGHRKHSATADNSPRNRANDSCPGNRAADSSPQKGKVAGHQRPQERGQQAAKVKQQHRAEAQRSDSEHAATSLQQNGHVSTSAPDAEHSKADEQDGGQNPSGWVRVRKVVRGSATPVKPTKDSVTAALESTSPPPEGNPDNRRLKHSDSSSGSMSNNTTGPLQYIYSRGGKMAAVLAMLGSKGKREDTDAEGKPAPDVPQPDDSNPCGVTSSGADSHPGDDRVSRFGASQPQQAAGSQVSCLTNCSICMSMCLSMRLLMCPLMCMTVSADCMPVFVWLLSSNIWCAQQYSSSVLLVSARLA